MKKDKHQERMFGHTECFCPLVITFHKGNEYSTGMKEIHKLLSSLLSKAVRM